MRSSGEVVFAVPMEQRLETQNPKPAQVTHSALHPHTKPDTTTAAGALAITKVIVGLG